MSFLEALFGRLWKPDHATFSTNPERVTLEEVEKAVQITAGYILKQPAPKIYAARLFTGYIQSNLFMPAFVGFFTDRHHNLETYRHLTVLASASQAMGLQHRGGTTSSTALRYEFLDFLPQVLHWISAFLPGYPALHDRWVRFLQEHFNRSIPPHLKGAVDSDSSFSKRLFQLSEDTDPFLFCWVPCLPTQRTDVIEAENLPQQIEKIPLRLHSEPEQTHDNPYASAPQRIDLASKQHEENPVYHSFEKLETLDHYQGGYRTPDSDGSLDSQVQALRELDLQQVTRDFSEHSTQSIYQSQLITDPSHRTSALKALTAPQDRRFQYPEWQDRTSSYLPSHCTLFETVAPSATGPSTFEALLQQRHGRLIRAWKRRIEQLVHEPLWMFRQLDGPEMDIDAVHRALTDIATGHTADPRLYARKHQRHQDLAITMLLDQSLSTDSWIAERRVLDLMIEAIGLSGLLFSRLLGQVELYSTWSATRHHCHVNVIKRHTEAWSLAYLRLAALQPEGYTRLGPALRHVTQRLQLTPARRKFLILLTDGKPTDLDAYEGQHGIHDVKRALNESHRSGIAHFALAIDRKVQAHFSEMFGKSGSFRVLDKPEKLAPELFHFLAKTLR